MRRRRVSRTDGITMWTSEPAQEAAEEVDEEIVEDPLPLVPEDPYSALRAVSARAAVIGFAGVVLLGAGVFVWELLPGLTDAAYELLDFPAGLTIFAGVGGIVYAVRTLIVWWDLSQAVRTTGWRDGTGTITRLNTDGFVVLAGYPDHAKAVLWVFSSGKQLGGFQNGAPKPIKVGGYLGRMVVLLPAGYWDHKDRLLRVKAVVQDGKPERVSPMWRLWVWFGR